LLAERLAHRRIWLDAVWLGMALALQFLAGHAQLWYYSLWAVTAYVLVRAWSGGRGGQDDEAPDRPGAWPRRMRIFALLGGAFTLALGLSAIQFLPTAELALQSQRAGGVDPREAMTYSMWPWRLLTLMVPNLFGSPASGDYWGYATYWEDAGYIGVLPLLLALSALWGWGRRKLSALNLFPLSFGNRRQRDVRRIGWDILLVGSLAGDFLIPFLGLLALVALVLAMGNNTPIYPLIFEHVPGFGAFRSPARFLLFYTFGVSTLAGLGADRFRLSYRVQYATRLTVAGAGAMLAVSLAVREISKASDLSIKPTFAPAIAAFALWLGLSAILVLLCPIRARLQPADDADPRIARSPLPAKVWHGLVIGLVSIDLALFAAPLTPSIDPALYHSVTHADRWLQAHTDDQRLFATSDYDYDTKFNAYLDFSAWGPSDLAHWLSFRETLVPNLNSFAHRSSVNNDEPLVVDRWRTLMEALHQADWPIRIRLLRMMNVGYILAQAAPPDLFPVEDVPELYRLPQPLPRAWMVPHARTISDAHNLLAELLSASFDPVHEVLLDANDIPDRPADFAPERNDATAVGSTASSSQPQPNRISLREGNNSRTIDLIISQPGYLVLSYTYYPGWRATVDGQPAEILRANYAFMAVPLKPGEHQVVLRYRPFSLISGAIISGLSLVVAMIGMVLRALQIGRPVTAESV
jgi:hypothetical protein